MLVASVVTQPSKVPRLASAAQKTNHTDGVRVQFYIELRLELDVFDDRGYKDRIRSLECVLAVLCIEPINDDHTPQ